MSIYSELKCRDADEVMCKIFTASSIETSPPTAQMQLEQTGNMGRESRVAGPDSLSRAQLRLEGVTVKANQVERIVERHQYVICECIYGYGPERAVYMQELFMLVAAWLDMEKNDLSRAIIRYAVDGMMHRGNESLQLIAQKHNTTVKTVRYRADKVAELITNWRDAAVMAMEDYWGEVDRA